MTAKTNRLLLKQVDMSEAYINMCVGAWGTIGRILACRWVPNIEINEKITLKRGDDNAWK